jgi:hypothetical protein
MNPDTRSSLPPSSTSTTFPSRMLASCAAGHSEVVDVEWQMVPGFEADTRMRVPFVIPRYCAECSAAARALVPYFALRFIENNVVPKHAPALSQPDCPQSH